MDGTGREKNEENDRLLEREFNYETIMEDLSKKEEAVRAALSKLTGQGDDKYARLAYQRTLDEIYFNKKNIYETNEYKRRAEEAKRRADELEQRREKIDALLEEKDALLEEQDALIAQLRARLGEK